MNRILKISLLAIAFSLGLGFIVYIYGRSIWHPILVKYIGGVTVNDVMGKVLEKKPYLGQIKKGGRLEIVAYKNDREMELFYNGKKIKDIKVLAASGKIGPKIKEGDYQVPEGIYGINAINPNSSYYLSLRISYPNKVDMTRSQSVGVSKYGGDIYSW